ncbi:uncharacterized protein [Diadema antillarum]|uniref:uncharacterized protein n=1 Tax=Diadema antillarum TaxID=105358 RepID=UPI003A857990
MMMKAPPWHWLETITFIVCTVLRLVSGQYSLQAPSEHVALFRGGLSVAFTIPASDLSFPPLVQLIDLSDNLVRRSKTVPLATSGSVKFECNYFDHAGQFQFRLQSTRNSSDILAQSDVVHVIWPQVDFSVPTNLVASSREFRVVAVTSNLCNVMRDSNRYIVNMLLVYHGKNLTASGEAIPIGDGAVADSFPIGTISTDMTVDFGCSSADRAGLYTVLLQSDFNGSTIARSQVFEAARNNDYGLSVSTRGVYPNCSGRGRVQPIEVRASQPTCPNDEDTIRLLGQDQEFSYAPTQSDLRHISEKRMSTSGTTMQFFCSEFSSEFTGFCFRYVSVARSGAVEDQVTVCIPLEYTGDPIDGQWSDWTSWGSCTATCGPGVRHRSRTCNNPSPANGGASCDGNLLMTEFCDLPPCPPEPTAVLSTTANANCFCGCTLTVADGTILSDPLFCESRNTFRWVISVPGNRVVRLEFVYFYLAIHMEYLRVRDGEHGDSPNLAYHTGVALPAPVVSTGNSMYIEYRMVRRGNLDMKGFKAFFSSFESAETPAPPLNVGSDDEPPVDVGQLNNTAFLIAGIALGVLVILFSIIFAIHARCSRSYDYKMGMPHDDTAETQLRGIGIGTSSINSSSTHNSRPWGAAPIGRSTTSQSEQSQQSTSKRGWPDGDRTHLYVVHNESANYLPDASLSSSHRSTKEILPDIPSPYHEEELEKWTRKHGHKITLPYHAADMNRGSAGELSNSRHSGRTDRNTTHLAMNNPEEYAMRGIHSHDSHTSVNSSRAHHKHDASHSKPQVQAVANVESTDNTSPYVNKDGQLTPLGLAVSKLNDNGLEFRIPEGAENPDQEKREYTSHRTHKHKDHSADRNRPDVTHSDTKKRKGAVHPEAKSPPPQGEVESGRKLPLAPKMAFYSDDEPDWRPPPPQPAVEDIKAETLPREKSSRTKSSSSRKHDHNHALSSHRTSREDGLSSGHSSNLRNEKAGSLDRHGRHDKNRKPPVPPRHGSKPKKHVQKPVVPPRPDPHHHVNNVGSSQNSSRQDIASYSLPSDHMTMSDYSCGQMSVEPSPIRLPRPLNLQQNRERLTQVFISDESLMRPPSGADRSGAESTRSATSHRQLPDTPPSGFSPPRPIRPFKQRVHSDLSISQDEPEFDYYIPSVPGSFFENPYPMAEGPSKRRINKMSKAKSPSASLV